MPGSTSQSMIDAVRLDRLDAVGSGDRLEQLVAAALGRDAGAVLGEGVEVGGGVVHHGLVHGLEVDVDAVAAVGRCGRGGGAARRAGPADDEGRLHAGRGVAGDGARHLVGAGGERRHVEGGRLAGGDVRGRRSAGDREVVGHRPAVDDLEGPALGHLDGAGRDLELAQRDRDGGGCGAEAARAVVVDDDDDAHCSQQERGHRGQRTEHGEHASVLVGCHSSPRDGVRQARQGVGCADLRTLPVGRHGGESSAAVTGGTLVRCSGAGLLFRHALHRGTVEWSPGATRGVGSSPGVRS